MERFDSESFIIGVVVGVLTIGVCIITALYAGINIWIVR